MSAGVGKFFGWILMTVGGLIMVLSGLCSTAVLFMVAGGLGRGQGAMGALPMLGMIALIGGIPFAVGGALFATGRLMTPPRTTYLPRAPIPPEDGEL